MNENDQKPEANEIEPDCEIMMAVSKNRHDNQMPVEFFVLPGLCHHQYCFGVVGLIQYISEIFGAPQEEILQYITEEIRNPTNQIHPDRLVAKHDGKLH